MLDRIQGALLGVHAGDSLGAGVEFLSREEVRRQHPLGVREITGGGFLEWEPGAPTDDTQLTILQARAYQQTQGDDTLVRYVADLFLTWQKTNPPDIGNTTIVGIKTYEQTGDPYTSGVYHPNAASNGSLMRTTPVGVVRHITDPRLIKEARALSAITHALPVCLSACVTYSQLVSMLIDGIKADEALEWAFENAPNARLREAIYRACHNRNPDLLPTPHEGHVLHAFRVAVWMLANDMSFEEGVCRAVWMGEDTDTLGAITGGLLGARDGIDSIPARWLDCLVAGDELLNLSHDLHRLRIS